MEVKCSNVLIVLIISLVQTSYSAALNETENFSFCHEIEFKHDDDNCTDGRKHPILGDCETYFKCDGVPIGILLRETQTNCPKGQLFDTKSLDCINPSKPEDLENCDQKTCQTILQVATVEKLEEYDDPNKRKDGQYDPSGQGQGQYSPNQTQRPGSGQYPPNQGQYQPNQGQYPTNQGRDSPNNGQYPPNQGQYPPNNGKYPPNQDQYPPKQDNDKHPNDPHQVDSKNPKEKSKATPEKGQKKNPNSSTVLIPLSSVVFVTFLMTSIRNPLNPLSLIQ